MSRFGQAAPHQHGCIFRRNRQHVKECACTDPHTHLHGLYMCILVAGIHHNKCAFTCCRVSNLSCHPPAVHRSWPIGTIQRLARRSSSEADFLQVKTQKIAEFKRAGFDQVTLDRAAMVTYNPGPPKPRTTRPEQHPAKPLWLRLPFHPVWHRAKLQAALNEMWQPWSAEMQAVARTSCIKIAWHNVEPHFIQKIRRC